RVVGGHPQGQLEAVAAAIRILTDLVEEFAEPEGHEVPVGTRAPFLAVGGDAAQGNLASETPISGAGPVGGLLRAVDGGEGLFDGGPSGALGVDVHGVLRRSGSAARHSVAGASRWRG